jgi:hypothetical protein
MLKKVVFAMVVAMWFAAKGQAQVDFSRFNKSGDVKADTEKALIAIVWPAAKAQSAKMVIDLEKDKPLFKSLEVGKDDVFREVAAALDPAFILTIGKRDLRSQNGWNIFFDTTNRAPHHSFRVKLRKRKVSIASVGSRTIIKVSPLTAGAFSGSLEITIYNGSPLFDVAAVMSTKNDSTAILYDAGLVSKWPAWKKIVWSDSKENLQFATTTAGEAAKNVEVKYRTIIGENDAGSVAVFPAPHQYFYPLDEAFNLKFTWYGCRYRNLLPEYGIGVRQDLMGDKRWVTWFNAPANTKQRLHFFCLLSNTSAKNTFKEVKTFTHSDSYQRLPGYKTMATHFHNEYVMRSMLSGKAEPLIPDFVNVFKKTGIDIVHLAEFHYTAHPKGPDDTRLNELDNLFDECKKFSSKNFLLLPGEEPNEFFGGHWLALFPKPVYWIMSRKADKTFVSEQPKYGKVYRIGSKQEMLRLLEAEDGLAWTAHARTKGSVGFPDKYKEENFFTSDYFLGATWKAMPADLSQPRLGKRALDVMDDMANWGLEKHVIGEADLFSVEPNNEMYAHLNVNYLQIDKLPKFETGWKPVLDAMRQGKFFVTTGEVLLPSFTINGKKAGETLILEASGKAVITLKVAWTFPLSFAEVISGDGKIVYRKRINLDNTKPFAQQTFTFTANLKNMKWVRVEVWDVAANGAFTQQLWLR